MHVAAARYQLIKESGATAVALSKQLAHLKLANYAET
jgi:hypothetical protein